MVPIFISISVPNRNALTSLVVIRHPGTQLDGRMTVRQDWYMAHDLEPFKGSVPDVPDATMAPWYQGPEMTARPEWTELRVPYREDSDLERRWSNVMLPVRAVALGTLWITYSVYRFGIFLAFAALIAVVFVVR